MEPHPAVSHCRLRTRPTAIVMLDLVSFTCRARLTSQPSHHPMPRYTSYKYRLLLPAPVHFCSTSNTHRLFPDYEVARRILDTYRHLTYLIYIPVSIYFTPMSSSDQIDDQMNGPTSASNLNFAQPSNWTEEKEKVLSSSLHSSGNKQH